MFLLRALVLGLATGTGIAQCPAWTSGFEPAGTDGTVRALLGVDQGGTPVLIAGGDFHHGGAVPIEHVGRWDGASWSPLGSGVDGPVLALAWFDAGSGPALYAAGAFSQASGVPVANIARWNGIAWSPLGGGLDATATALVVHDDGSGPALYATGEFTHAGGTPAAGIARWNGTSWSALGTGFDAAGNALAVHNGELYAGGDFLAAGGVQANYVARWNGSAWSALGGGMNAAVLALVSYDSGSGARLYAGGAFAQATGGGISYIASWNGTAWSSVSPFGLDGIVWSLAVHQNGATRTLVAGGEFTRSGPVDMLHVGAWNGTAWNPIAGGIPGVYPHTGRVHAVAQVPGASGGTGALYAGGNTGNAMSANVTRFTNASLSGGAWVPLGAVRGVDGIVFAMQAHDDGSGPALYVGGRFNTVAGAFHRAIARWNGQQWSDLQFGIYSNCTSNPVQVDSIVTFDAGSGPELYAGGAFSSASGVSAPGIARWNGTTWSGVAGGLTFFGGSCGSVRTMRVYDAGGGPEIFVAGSFSYAGGVFAPRIARFDGTSWFPVGPPTSNGDAIAMTVHDDGVARVLVVGGGFTTFGGVSAAHVATWNGTEWAPLGAGLPITVTAVASFDAGDGARIFAGTNHGLYRFDGATWTLVAPALGLSILSLTVFDDGSGGGPALYGGGSGGESIGRWTGSGWASVAGGLTLDTAGGFAFASFDDGGGPALFVGGVFGSAGGIPSSSIARMRACGPVSSFCGGDGADAHVTTACPCGNAGGAGRGCAWHAGPTGALLAASGAPNPDTVVLTASGMPSIAPSTIFLKGDELIASGVVFGDGLRCIGGNLIRLGTKVNVAGAAQYPEAGNPSISVRGATPPSSGELGYYQTYYRNAAVFCTSATFNVTNAVRIVW